MCVEMCSLARAFATNTHKVANYINSMGESSEFLKSGTFEIQNSKQAVCLQNDNNFKLNGQLS